MSSSSDSESENIAEIDVIDEYDSDEHITSQAFERIVKSEIHQVEEKKREVVTVAPKPAKSKQRHKSVLLNMQGPKKVVKWLEEYSNVMLEKVASRLISSARVSAASS